MSTDKQDQTENRIETMQLQLIEAIKSQEQLNVQLSRRNSRIVSYGVFILLAFIAIILFLTWSQQQNTAQMSNYIEEMAQDVSSMTSAIGNLQNNMRSLEQGINNVARHTQTISRSIVQPDNSVAVLVGIADSVKGMQKDAHGFNKSIENINYNLTKINKQMKSLNRKLGIMGQDVNRMPSPVKMFPF